MYTQFCYSELYINVTKYLTEVYTSVQHISYNEMRDQKIRLYLSSVIVNWGEKKEKRQTIFALIYETKLCLSCIRRLNFLVQQNIFQKLRVTSSYNCHWKGWCWLIRLTLNMPTWCSKLMQTQEMTKPIEPIKSQRFSKNICHWSFVET